MAAKARATKKRNPFKNAKFTRVEHNKHIFTCEVSKREFWVEKRTQRRIYCGHGHRLYNCIVCRPQYFCKPHRRRKIDCVACETATCVCVHGCRDGYCRPCIAAGTMVSRFCKHDRKPDRCVDCDGSYICIHKRRISSCFICRPESPDLCGKGCGLILSKQRRARGIKTCARCERREDRQARVEHEWLERFRAWGFTPSSHDEIIKDAACKVTNRRRADYVFLCYGLPYNVVVECDENSHAGYDVSCEMKRLQDVHDQLMSNKLTTKPIVVIRFNPFAKLSTLEEDVKRALEEAFQGLAEHTDARGVNLFKVIGYSKTRAAQYKENELTQKIAL